MDEPTAGLDPTQRRVFRSLLEQLADDDVHIVVSTHQTEDLADLYQRVVVLHRGTVRFHGTAAQAPPPNSTPWLPMTPKVPASARKPPTPSSSLGRSDPCCSVPSSASPTGPASCRSSPAATTPPSPSPNSSHTLQSSAPARPWETSEQPLVPRLTLPAIPGVVRTVDGPARAQAEVERAVRKAAEEAPDRRSAGEEEPAVCSALDAGRQLCRHGSASGRELPGLVRHHPGARRRPGRLPPVALHDALTAAPRVRRPGAWGRTRHSERLVDLLLNGLAGRRLSPPSYRSVRARAC